MKNLPKHENSPSLTGGGGRSLKQILTILLCACVLLVPEQGEAQTVRLTAKDGSLSVDGAFLGFDGRFLRIDSIYGVLTIDSASVICKGAACPEETDPTPHIRFSGEARIAEDILPDLLAGFAEHEGLELEVDPEPSPKPGWAHFTFREEGRLVARISVHATSSDEGFADLISEVADIALTIRPPRMVEIAMSRSAGAGDLGLGRRAYVIGRNALAVLGPNKKTLSLGEIANSGPTEATTDQFTATALQYFFPELQRGAGQELSITTLEAMPTNAALATACTHPIKATMQTVKTGDYPLSLPLMLYTPARRLPEISRAFLTYIEANAEPVDRLVKQDITRIEIDQMGRRLSNAISHAGGDIGLSDLQRVVDTLGTTRLSSTFRFEPGSTRLDPVAHDTLSHLARFMRGLDPDRTVILAGFGEGDSDTSLERSGKLAQTVREALDRFGPFPGLTFQIEAFGQAVPIFCDDTDLSRKTNERVEVWLK